MDNKRQNEGTVCHFWNGMSRFNRYSQVAEFCATSDIQVLLVHKGICSSRNAPAEKGASMNRDLTRT